MSTSLAGLAGPQRPQAARAAAVGPAARPGVQPLGARAPAAAAARCPAACRRRSAVVVAAVPAAATPDPTTTPHLQLATARLPADVDRDAFLRSLYQWAGAPHGGARVRQPRNPRALHGAWRCARRGGLAPRPPRMQPTNSSSCCAYPPAAVGTLTSNGRNLPFALPLDVQPLAAGFKVRCLACCSSSCAAACCSMPPAATAAGTASWMHCLLDALPAAVCRCLCSSGPAACPSRRPSPSLATPPRK